MFDKEGGVGAHVSAFGKGEECVRGVSDLRFVRDLVNFDNGVVVNL